MKIILVNPPIKYSVNPLPPLGIAYIAAVLRKNGFTDTAIIDGAGEFLNEREILNRIIDAKPQIVGLSVMSNVWSVSSRVCRLIKEKLPDVFICWGGAHATALPEHCLSSGAVDLVFRHEAEFSFLEVVKRIELNSDFHDINGICYIKDGKTVCNPRTPRIRDLDDLPLPARDLLPMNRYATSSWFRTRGVKSTVIFATRGCPYDCTYCANKVCWGDRKFVLRNTGKVVDEIQMLIKRYGYNGFQFSDECITASRKYIIRFCREILSRKIRISWVCSSFVTNITYDILALMKQAGCEFINFGIESGCYEVRKRMKKDISDESIYSAVLWSKKVGLRVGCCFMLGCPDETADEAKQTINMARKLNPHEVAFNILVPYPGTELYYKYIAPKNLDINWDEAMSFDPLHPDTPKVFFNCSKLSDTRLISLYREARRKVELNPFAINMMLNRLRHASSLKHLWVIVSGGIKLLFKR
ncbi:MAG: radical SAM protein [bacterium]